LCPIEVYVSNSGEHVITVAEWHDFEKLPIVVYGEKGRMVNVYGELRHIVNTNSFLSEDPSISGGIWFPHSMRGWHWLSHSLMFFGQNDDRFVVRLRNKDILVFDTATGRIIDDKWKDVNCLFPDEIKKYDDFQNSLQRLIVLKALQLASSDRQKERGDGLFVLNQCRDRDSIKVLEQAMKDKAFRIIDKPQGKIRQYTIRKAAIDALKAIGEKVPENIVTEEKYP
jgi:hypothetical protein